MATTVIKQPQAPIWGDAKDVRAFVGLPKTTLERLRRGGKVRSSSLQEEGTKRGKRLYHLPSLLAFLESRATGGIIPTGVAE